MGTRIGGIFIKSRIGIIGPYDSVQTILDVAKELTDTLICIPFIYSDIDETIDIVKNKKEEVDVWLFSGQAPYALAEKYLTSNNGFYPQLNGSSLSKVLLDISYKAQMDLNAISFDTIFEHDVYETFSELGLHTEGLKLYPYSGYKPPEELFQYHYQLYQNKEVHSCVTGVHSVYKRLKSKGVPVYRIQPTRMSLRETLQLASHRGETIHFKNSQIAVLVLHINDMNKFIGESNLFLETYRTGLKIQEVIIGFTEKCQGSFIQQGNDKFIIFSTRGTLETYSYRNIFDLLDKIKFITKLDANIGIGYGKSVFEAEQNAYVALSHTSKFDNSTIMLVRENGVIEGPLQSENEISYNRRIEDSDVLEKLNQSGISVGTYNKVVSIQNRLNNNAISAGELASWLGMTQRNARRILHELEKVGLSEVIGEEMTSARGRPTKIYRVGHKT